MLLDVDAVLTLEDIVSLILDDMVDYHGTIYENAKLFFRMLKM